MGKAFVTLIAAVVLVGCYSNVGPVITDVRLENGTLRYTRCELEVASWFNTGGGGDFHDCVSEAGKKVSPPDQWTGEMPKSSAP
jgi:hypothetical protein